MKKTSHWDKAIVFLALVLNALVGMKATATVFTSTTLASKILQSEPNRPHQGGNFQLAQGLVGQCRAATRSVFIYQDRSTSYGLRALQPTEQVTLAEDRSRGGWIAISAPISGFVQTKDLKRCFEDEDRNTEAPPPPPSSLCRQVRYRGNEGVAVRVRPDRTSRQVGAVFFREKITLSNPPEFTEDNERRQWVRIAAPSSGWMSNGRLSDDSNLEVCS